MGIINSSNSELETLKSQGPFRIQSSDNSNFKNMILNEIIVNEPIIIKNEDLYFEKIIQKAEEYEFNKWENKP
jgi:hypothetical protein